MGKLSRLRSMPTNEIGYRLRERARVETDRIRHAMRVESPPPQIHGDCLPFLQQAFTECFYVSTAARESVRSLVQTEFPHWVDRAVREADQLCNHRLELLGYGQVDLGPKINWHRDPVTGMIWPRRFWAEYDPVNDVSSGDSKTIHELNRHQHLPRLAKAYLLTGEQRYAQEAIDQLESWIEQNPAGLGINWQSSLEIAIRVLSWLWTIAFLLPSPAFTQSFARRITCSLLAQLRHVRTYPSVYSSPNTHLIGEATALFIAGMLFKEVAKINDAASWRDFGARILVQEAERQILDDGVHCELSTSYHCYTADFYLQALILGRRNGFAFPCAVTAKVSAMMEYVLYMTRPDGSLPQLGDDDGGRALALYRQDYRSFVDGLCLAAALLQRPDFKWSCGDSSKGIEETLWLLGEPGLQAFRELNAAPPSVTSRAFPSAGYFVHRSGWSAGDSHAVFDCGGLGTPTGGHGHADALSVVLFTAGRDLLIDPGTFVYNTSREWRNHFRSTAAHNTVVIDGQNQSEPAGTFQWTTQARTGALVHSTHSGSPCAEGEHRGYAASAAPVVHKRRLVCEPDRWVIEDEFSGSGEHTFDFYFHFAPGVTFSVSPSSRFITVLLRSGEYRATMRFHAPVATNAEVLEGWVSPRYGRRELASVVVFRMRTTPPLSTATVVMPFRKGGDPCAASAES